MKDHEISKVVNELRDIATQYHDTQQLRERIAHVVVPLLAHPEHSGDGGEKSAAAVAVGEPKGWKLVPIDLTDRMRDEADFAMQKHAGDDYSESDSFDGWFQPVWSAILKGTPPAPIASAEQAVPVAALTVWYGSMPESNGKTNWTAILHNGDMASGMTIDRSEYPDRVRYAADRVRWLIGDLDKEPWILDYDADKHSGYTHPASAQPSRAEVLTDAARDVLTERQRQISKEGWTPEHDDDHRNDELSLAAACYALEGVAPYTGLGIDVKRTWPLTGWDWAWWKPKDRRRNLIKAGALILAEIERLDRSAKP